MSARPSLSKKKAKVAQSSDSELSDVMSSESESESDHESDDDLPRKKKRKSPAKNADSSAKKKAAPVKRATKKAAPSSSSAMVVTAKAPSKPEAAATAGASSAAAPKAVNQNETITKFLFQLAAAEKANGDVHKQMAFIKAANALRGHPTKVASGKEAQQLKGIGPKIALIVQEIIDTGGLRQLSAARDADHERALTELSSVFGLGAASIKALMDDHRVTSLVALRQFAQQRPDDVAPAVHMGIKYHTDFMQPIPRAECDALVEAVADRVRANVDARFEVTACGAHRRGAAESSDVDLVVTHPDASNDADEHARGDSKLAQWSEAIVDCLKTGGLVCDTISSSAATFVGVCSLPPPKPAVPVSAPAIAEAESAPAPKKRFSIPKMADADSVARESGPTNILFRAGSVFGDAEHSTSDAPVAASMPSAAASASSVVGLTADAVTATAAAAVSSRRFFRRITVRLVPWSARACATLYYTGPEALNRRLNEAAAARGLALSEHALVRADSGVAVRVDSEADVFAAIGEQNINPGLRV